MTEEDPRFKTHIKESRWQQIASAIVALGIFGGWLWLLLHR